LLAIGFGCYHARPTPRVESFPDFKELLREQQAVSRFAMRGVVPREACHTGMRSVRSKAGSAVHCIVRAGELMPRKGSGARRAPIVDRPRRAAILTGFFRRSRQGRDAPVVSQAEARAAVVRRAIACATRVTTERLPVAVEPGDKVFDNEKNADQRNSA
jgi:hypothetical protein